MALRRHSNSGMPSIEACLPKAFLMVQSNGAAISELDDGLLGSVAGTCCVLDRGESLGSMMDWHKLIPSGIVGCDVKAWSCENRASI